MLWANGRVLIIVSIRGPNLIDETEIATHNGTAQGDNHFTPKIPHMAGRDFGDRVFRWETAYRLSLCPVRVRKGVRYDEKPASQFAVA